MIPVIINKRFHEKPQYGTLKRVFKLYPDSSKANFIEESTTTCLFSDIKKNFEPVVPSLPFLVNRNMAICLNGIFDRTQSNLNFFFN